MAPRHLPISVVVACFSLGILLTSTVHARDVNTPDLLKIKDERELEDSIVKALSYSLDYSTPLEAQNPFKIAELGERYRKLVFLLYPRLVQSELIGNCPPEKPLERCSPGLAMLDRSENQPDMRDVFTLLNDRLEASILESIAVRSGDTISALDFSEVNRDLGMYMSIKYSGSFSSIDIFPEQASTLQTARRIAKKNNLTIAVFSLSPSYGTGSEITHCYNENDPWMSTPEICQLNTWIIQASGKVDFHTKSVKTAQFAQALRALEYSDNFDSIKPELDFFSQLLIKPNDIFFPKESSDSRVIFVVPSAFTAIPFSLLKDSTGRYLIERTAIAMAPSIRILDEVYKRELTKPSEPVYASLFANPKMPKLVRKPCGRSICYELSSTSDFEPLPGSETEVREISKVVASTVYVGMKASVDNLLDSLRNSSIVHIASHMLGDYWAHIGAGYPRGALVLAPSKRNPWGLLTAVEITGIGSRTRQNFRRSINSSLVVLSGCNSSSGGTGTRGNGLTRALIIGGSSTVVSSLEPLYDQATAQIMVDFYRNLTGKANQPISIALRQAILGSIKRKDSPSSWAPFILTGLP